MHTVSRQTPSPRGTGRPVPWGSRKNRTAWWRNLEHPWAPVLLGCVSSLLILPIYDKYWFPYDEGWILVNAQRILAGEFPYRDFWMQYPPGQFYVLAWLLKVFGVSLLPGRLLTVALHGAIAGAAFHLARRCLGSRGALVTWLLCTATMVARMGPMPAPTWMAVFLGLLSVSWLARVLAGGRVGDAVFAGALAGLAAWFRHDVGGLTWAAGALAIALVWGMARGRGELHARIAGRHLAAYTVAAGVPVVAAVVWLWAHGALEAAVQQALVFPLTAYPQTRAIPWPRPIVNPLMLFHGGMAFIEANQFYLPILVYAFVGIELVRRWRAREFGACERALVAVLALGVLWLQHIRVRTDIMHLVFILPPAFVLAPVLLGWWRAPGRWHARFLRRAAVLLAGLLVVPFTVRSLDKYVKNTYKKPWRGQTRLVDFGSVGRVYVPADQAEAASAVVREIRVRTAPGTRMYVGPAWHGDPQGAPLIFHFLGQRLPVTRYHTTAPGLTDTEPVQRDIMQGLQSDAQLVVLEGDHLGGSPTPLDIFLRERWVEVARVGPLVLLESR